MQKDVSFFGMKFTQLQFILFFFGWMFFLGFIWPFIIGSYLFMSIFVCGFSVIFVGLFNRLMALLLLLLLFVNESLIRIYQNVVLFITIVLATLIYSIWIPMNFWIYMAHLAINTFSVFLMYNMFYKKDTGNIQDEIIILDDED